MSDTEKVTEQSSISEPKQPGNQTTTLLKLVAVLAILFVAIKYGQPLMQKFASSASEKLDEKAGKNVKPDKDTKENPADSVATPTEPKKSTVKITDGFETWEPTIRKQLEEWIERGVSYELIRVSVNDSKTMMEIDYRTIKDEVRTRQPVIILKKDGFDGRFILRLNNKEFVVYPPENT